MTTTAVKAFTTTLSAATDERLDSWGPRAGATGGAETSGKSFLPHQDLPGVGITGVWECTAGSWHVEPRPLTEVTVVLAGHGQVTDEDGQVHDLNPGDVIVLPAGWTGQWTIVDRLRKFYVVSPA